ncbi:alkene reductase [Arenimonas sp.]|uniref:alkene reductase n=1 Tax=Arenimonas sp. TaxID=1872635 RepID=UPI0025BAA75E|nr:alkene reductase [Arenimonas sp.]
MTRLLDTPYERNGLKLKNRVVMAPMTRSRAEGNLPNALMAEYYGQRAGAGLVISEGAAPAPDGLGYARIPGIFNEAQAQGWGAIAQALHAGGSRLFIQLMHSGRVGATANLPAGETLVAPSAIPAAGETWTDTAGMQPNATPRAATAEDLVRLRQAHIEAARLAIAHGVDGVELHGANGYLLGQFLNPRSNQRTDGYGGSADNRNRFVIEVVDATVAAIGKARVGVRLSPFNPFNDLEVNFEGEREQFLALVDALAARDIAYLHLAGGSVTGELLAEVRRRFPGTLIANGGYDGERAENDLASGVADLVSFGRPFIANPDLPERLRTGAPIADLDAGTLYTPGAAGYTDYPRLGAGTVAA